MPAAISIWPPAYGWFIMLALLLFAILISVRWWHRYQQHRRFHQGLMKEFSQIQSRYTNDKNTIRAVRATSIFLRRVALAYYPRQQVASATGEKWLGMLNNMSAAKSIHTELGQLILTAPYMKKAPARCADLFVAVECWLRQLHVGQFIKE